MRLLQIFPGEGAKTAWFAALGFLVHCGLAMGLSVTDAVFLSELGADELPMVYVIMPLFMILFTPLSSYIQSRFSIEKALSIALVAIACGAATLAILFQTSIGDGNPGLVIFSGKIFTSIWYIGLYTIFWNFVDAYFPLSEGKRLYGIINAGSCGGVILAGGLLTALSSRVDSFWILYIWAALSILSIPVSIAIRRRFVNLEDTGESDTESVADTIRSSMRAVRRSKYALFTALLYFLLPLLNTTNEYLSFSVFSKYGNEQEIIALFGQLYSIAYVFNLIISLFAFNFLVARIGVRNIVLIQPLVYFAAFFWYFSDFTFAAAVFGFFAYQTILCAVDNNNANLLFNALPHHEKRSIRTFIEGMGEPIAIAISGAALMYGLNTFPTGKIALFGIATTFVAAITAYIINQLYVGGIADNLKGDKARAKKAIGETRDSCCRNPLSQLDSRYPPASKPPAIRLDSELARLTKRAGPDKPYTARAAASRLRHAEPEEIPAILGILQISRDAPGLVDAIRARTDYTEQERQTLMEAISNAGLGAIPGLLNILHHPHSGYPMRSLALEALAGLSFAQVEFAWEDLLIQATQEAKFLRDVSVLIPDTITGQTGFPMLRRSIQELEDHAFEWMLQILSSAGRIPDHIIILASLNSGNPKDRANAAEILIEGLGISGFRHIEAYFKHYPSSDKTGDSGNTRQDSACSGQATSDAPKVIQLALRSNRPWIAAAAAQACIRHEANLDPDLIWSALPHTSDSSRSWILPELSTDDTNIDTQPDSPFTRLMLLRDSPLFSSLKVHEIHALIDYFQPVSLALDAPVPEGFVMLPMADTDWTTPASTKPVRIARGFPLGLPSSSGSLELSADLRTTGTTHGLMISFERLQRIHQIHPKTGFSVTGRSDRDTHPAENPLTMEESSHA